jgi:hypothetical protein
MKVSLFIGFQKKPGYPGYLRTGRPYRHEPTTSRHIPGTNPLQGRPQGSMMDPCAGIAVPRSKRRSPWEDPSGAPAAAKTSGFAGTAVFIFPAPGGTVPSPMRTFPRIRTGGIFVIGFPWIPGSARKPAGKKSPGIPGRRLNRLLRIFLNENPVNGPGYI